MGAFIQAFSELARDCRQATGLDILWKDADPTMWTRLPAEMTQHQSHFCQQIKSDPEQLRQCIKADAAPADYWQDTQQARCRRCPFGWQEVEVPIYSMNRYQGTCYVGGWPPDKQAQWKPGLATARMVAGLVSKLIHLRSLSNQETTDSRFYQAQDIIEQQLSRELRAEQVAQAIHLSTSRFVHWFKEQSGQPYSTYLKARIMDRAAMLIAQGDLRITDIAMQLGYSHLPAFTAAFKRHTGLAPNIWKKQLRA